jgi:hypothetical protein
MVCFLVILATMYQSYKVRGWVEIMVINKVQEEMKVRVSDDDDDDDA